MDTNLVSIILAILSGIGSYFMATKQSKSEIDKIKVQTQTEIDKIRVQSQNDIEKLKLEHQQRLETLEKETNLKNNSNKESLTLDMTNQFIQGILNGQINKNQVENFKEVASMLSSFKSS